MLSPEAAQEFAREWIASWNSHDIERVLSHYTDDFEMSSPFIAAFAGEPLGTLKGKPQVRAYWEAALARLPDLNFELLDVFTGADSLTIYYKAVMGKFATEVLLLNENGKVYKALAHYNG